MPAKIDADSNLRFLYSCFKHSNYTTINYQNVASDFDIKSPAARMRLMRLKAALEAQATSAATASASTAAGDPSSSPFSRATAASSKDKSKTSSSKGVSTKTWRKNKGKSKGSRKRKGAGDGDDDDDDDAGDDDDDGDEDDDEDEETVVGRRAYHLRIRKQGIVRKREPGWIGLKEEDEDDWPLMKRCRFSSSSSSSSSSGHLKMEQLDGRIKEEEQEADSDGGIDDGAYIDRTGTPVEYAGECGVKVEVEEEQEGMRATPSIKTEEGIKLETFEDADEASMMGEGRPCVQVEIKQEATMQEVDRVNEKEVFDMPTRVAIKWQGATDDQRQTFSRSASAASNLEDPEETDWGLENLGPQFTVRYDSPPTIYRGIKLEDQIFD